MASVDNRVVSITFDNASFQKKLEDTLKNLDKLTQSLAFPNLKNNSAELSKAFSGFNMASMSSAIDGISGKFIALATIGITALSNIANRAVNAGITLVKSLSFDQISSGFAEYETNMNSIQTILANTTSKGSDLRDVNAALDELNQYADQTIYNFSEMTRNIGTFTAAGVDLDTSVSAIKGIANLAAISGSNSQQASTAMYQLSQAMASGTVKLMDWNSVVNAGMGGEVFQKALFESGKAAKTLADVPIGQTFDEWKDAGNSFRGSLETGWITGEVLTNTLQGFTGDLTDAQIMSMGYTAEQTAEIQKMGDVGKEAATKVKTLTQLISTVREAVGSGWSQSFRTIFGDFNEAKNLFSGLSDAIGGMVGRSADSRNELLGIWKTLGGRDLLIQGLADAFKGLGSVLAPIREAFREVFPKTTAIQLLSLTGKFAVFAKNMTISGFTVDKVKAAFKGLFDGFAIGIEIVKGIIGVIGDLFSHFVGTGGDILTSAASFGEFVSNLRQVLIEGGKLEEFFAKLTEVIKDPLPFIQQLKDKLLDFVNGLVGFELDFTSFEGLTEIFDRIKDAIAGLFGEVDSPALDGMVGLTGRITDRFSGLLTAVRLVWNKLSTPPPGLQKFLDLVDVFVEEMKTQFSLLGENIAGAMSTGDFDPVMDVINTGLLGGLVLAFNRIASGGLDFGGGFFAGMTEALGSLTGVLEGMQAKLKAEALMKIAGAIAVLAASVLVLSLIDSGALTKALIAIAVGFTQLVAALAILNSITGPGTAVKLIALSTSLAMLGAAILLLSFAVKVMSTIDLVDMAKGLLGITVLLGVLSLAVKPLSANASGMVQAGVGIVALAAGLLLLSYAVKAFADMSWADMGKGMAGVAAGLLAITAAVRLMPPGMPAIGVGIILVATGLLILSKAVQSFSDLSWTEMSKGMTGIAAGLLIIAGAMNLMPGKKMVATGAGLVLVGIALNLMAAAVKAMSALSWTEMGKGLAGLAGMLLLLAVATNAMSGSLAGAAAIGIVAYSLGTLQQVLLAFSAMSFESIAKGLLAVALTLVTLGLTAVALTPAIGPMFALGAAMLLLSGAFALFGLGASLAAAAFLSLAVAGKAGVTVILFVFDELLKRLPEVGLVFAATVIGFVQTLLDNAPRLIAAGVGMISALIDGIITLIPKFGELIGTIITSMLILFTEKVPEFVAAGFALLTGFLKGIRDNIGEIVTIVADIIINFFDALTAKVPEVIDSVYNFLSAVVEGVITKAASLTLMLLPFGTDLLAGFFKGIVDKAVEVTAWFLKLPADILGWIGNVTKTLITKGINFIAGLLEGIVDKVRDVTTWFQNLPSDILGWIGDVAKTLMTKGINFISGLLDGIVDKAIAVIDWFQELPSDILVWIGDVVNTLKDKGISIITGFFTGVISKAIEVGEWFGSLGSSMASKVGDLLGKLASVGRDLIQGLWNGAKEKWEAMKGWLSSLNPAAWFNDINPYKGHAIKNLVSTGGAVMQGLRNGMETQWDKTAKWLRTINPAAELNASSIATTISNLYNTISDHDIGNLNPVITPVLDLTGVQKDAKKLSGFFPKTALATTLAYDQAKLLSKTYEDTRVQTEPIVTTPTSTSVNFEQNVYSPTALSTNDIYRATRNQIALAKEGVEHSMKLTNVALYSNEAEVANFSFRDPSSINPYVATGIFGLDAEEIVPKFYGTSKITKSKYYTPSLARREIVIRISLNPEFSAGKTYSDLRDDLYRAIASSRTALIQLRFNNGFTTIAAISGFVTKFEAPHFSETAEVQITMRCNDPTLKALDPFIVDHTELGVNNTVDDELSTAPHGFQFNITFTQNTPSFIINDALNPEWSFTVIPGLINNITGFIAGDRLYFSSEFNNKYLYILRDSPGTTIHLIDKIQLGSVWPIFFPNNNSFNVVTGAFVWDSMTYYPIYWGV